MYCREAITFGLGVLFAQLTFFSPPSCCFTALCPNYLNIKCLWEDKYSVPIAFKAGTRAFNTKGKRCSHNLIVIQKKWKGF